MEVVCLNEFFFRQYYLYYLAYRLLQKKHYSLLLNYSTSPTTLFACLFDLIKNLKTVARTSFKLKTQYLQQKQNKLLKFVQRYRKFYFGCFVYILLILIVHIYTMKARYLYPLLFIAFVTLFITACGNSDKQKKRRKLSPIAELADTNIVQTEAMGIQWYNYINNAYRVRMKLPRSPYSDLVEKTGKVVFVGWAQADTSMFKAGQITYLADEPGVIFQVYKRPLLSYNKEYYDFEELGADFYQAHHTNRKRLLLNGEYIMLQDSSIRAFAFDTEIDFGEQTRTPIFTHPDRLDDKYENIQLRTPARVIYLSHKKFNFRIIYQKNNSLSEGTFKNILFF